MIGHRLLYHLVKCNSSKSITFLFLKVMMHSWSRWCWTWSRTCLHPQKHTCSWRGHLSIHHHSQDHINSFQEMNSSKNTNHAFWNPRIFMVWHITYFSEGNDSLIFETTQDGRTLRLCLPSQCQIHVTKLQYAIFLYFLKINKECM